MARPRVKTDQEIKEDKKKRYKERYYGEDEKSKIAQANDKAKREAYLASVTQIKLTLPKAQGDELKAYCDEKGIKPQKLITQFLLDQGIISPMEEAAPEEGAGQENN